MGNANKQINWNPLDSPIWKGITSISSVPDMANAMSDETLNRDSAQAKANEAKMQAASDKKSADYLSGVKSQEKLTADEDAFNRARSAARRAKGNTLFGAYNG